MICPRCGLKIRVVTSSRCPRCYQPLHPPFAQAERVTKLAPGAEATPAARPSEQEVWPDLSDPPMPLARPAPGTTPLRSAFRARGAAKGKSTGALAATLLDMGRRLPLNKRTLLLATVVVLLVLILGGTLFTVRALTGLGHTSSHTSGQTSAAASATARSTASARASATKPVGKSPTVTPTAAPHLVTIFSDPLTSNANHWTTPDGCSFQSDGLHVTGTAQCIAPVTAADTVNISVRMKTVESGSGGAGIGFRMVKGESSHQYTFYLDFNGVCVAQDQVTRTTFFAKSCPSAHLGRNAVNTLLINQSGAHMDFYVNGTFIGSATDATLGTGEVALEGAKSRQSVIFTNFALTTWK